MDLNSETCEDVYLMKLLFQYKLRKNDLYLNSQVIFVLSLDLGLFFVCVVFKCVWKES